MSAMGETPHEGKPHYHPKLVQPADLSEYHNLDIDPYDGLNDRQRLALDIAWSMSGTEGKLNLARIARETGVSRRTLYDWLTKNELFKALWDEQAKHQVRARMPQVLNACLSKAEDGDVAAIKLIFEFGNYIDKNQPAQQHQHIHLDMGKLSNEEIDALREALGKARVR